MPEMHVSLRLLYMSGVYLHIPFCKQACHYCDFHFSTNTAAKGELIECMAEEIAMQKNYLEGETVKTIYFGGGTPSLAEPQELSRLLELVFTNHTVAPKAEITLEANPDDLTLETLQHLRAVGINRLSIGIQSFDDGILKYLNRVHDMAAAIESVHLARRAGFENISIDLIYAIPGMTERMWEDNLTMALELNPPHVSAYTLTIEEKTTFGNWLKKGKLQMTDEASSARQFQTLASTLSAAGYDHYEISNFSRPGYQSQHNSSYWSGEKYLGVGPGAHSYDGESRQFNIPNNHLYIRSIREGTIPFEREILTARDRINEFIFTGLRTSRGCSIRVLKEKFGHDLLHAQRSYLERLSQQRLVSIEDEYLRLTDAGRLLADRICSDLFLVE